MKKYFESVDLETATDIETAGFETIADILKDQQETARTFIEMVQTVCLSAIETIKTQDENRNVRENARLEFDKYKFEKMQEKEKSLHVRPSCICKSIKDNATLSSTPLAPESSESTERQAKKGSRARKKTT